MEGESKTFMLHNSIKNPLIKIANMLKICQKLNVKKNDPGTKRCPQQVYVHFFRPIRRMAERNTGFGFHHNQDGENSPM